MRNDCLVVPEGASHKRGGHFLATILRRQCAIMNRGIRVLDQPRKEADEHGARLRIGEFLSE